MVKKKEPVHGPGRKHDNKKSPEEIYSQLQMYETQINQISQELQMLDARKQEVDRLVESIDELKNSKKDSDSYSPIGPGVFVKSQVKDTKHLLMNVGAGIIVKKDVESAKKILEEQAKNLEEAKTKMNNALQLYYSQAQAIQSDLHK